MVLDKPDKPDRGKKRPKGLQQEDLPAVVKELIHGSDRAVAILGCSLVDSTLEESLPHFIPNCGDGEFDLSPAELFTYRRPLGDFSSRIDIGYAFRIFSNDVWWDLHTIRIIRNRFAHGPQSLKFADGRTASLCQGLRCINHKVLKKYFPDGDLDNLAKLKDARLRYTYDVIGLATLFVQKVNRKLSSPMFLSEIPDIDE